MWRKRRRPIRAFAPFTPHPGIHAARADWVAFIDVDDLWHPLKLERQLRVHWTKRVDLIVSGYTRFRDGSQRLASWRCPPRRLNHRRLLRANVIPLLTVIVRRTWVVEGFPALPHEDYLRWLELFRRRPSLVYCCLPELLAAWVYRVHRAHGQSRCCSAAALMPWAAHQLATEALWRCHPLWGSLNEALAAVPPVPLPPTGSS